MEVILTEDVPKLGEMGEIVSVAPGYGRNYLIPQGLAIPATSGNKKQINHQLDLIEQRKEREREEAQGVYEELNGISITIPKRASDEDSLYGSVNAREIAEVLKQQDHEVTRKMVVLEQPISELGIYRVPIKLASGIYADVDVWVIAM
jgi:large subunit ribosomal protein L9